MWCLLIRPWPLDGSGQLAHSAVPDRKPSRVDAGLPRSSRDLLGRFTRIAVTNMLLALILKFGLNMTPESESCVFTALAEGRDS
jgi:hypothetical protein